MTTKVIPVSRLVWVLALVLALLFAFYFGAAPAARAATRDVCLSGCPYTSIQAAINAANIGDTIAVAAGMFTESGITVSKSVTIQGQGATQTIVQSASTAGTASDRVFSVNFGVTVTIQDLTVQHGVAFQGGGIYNQGTLTLRRVTVTKNTTPRGPNCNTSGCFAG